MLLSATKSAACSGKKMGKATAATTSTKRPDIGKCGTDIFFGGTLKKKLVYD